MKISDLFEAEQKQTAVSTDANTPNRTVLASQRFLSDWQNFKSVQGFTQGIDRFLAHWEPKTQSGPFKPNDIVQTVASRKYNLTPLLRTSHIKHGKILVAYQIFPDQIRLIDIGTVDNITQNLDSVASYASTVTPENSTAWSPPPPSTEPEQKGKKPKKIKTVVPPVTQQPTTEPVEEPKPLPPQPKPLSNEQVVELKEMFILLARDEEEGLKVLSNVKFPTTKLTLWDSKSAIADFCKDNNEFLEWCRVTLNLDKSDKNWDVYIIEALGGISKVKIMINKLLQIAAQFRK